jgi:hypothetical protein
MAKDKETFWDGISNVVYGAKVTEESSCANEAGKDKNAATSTAEISQQMKQKTDRLPFRIPHPLE